MKQIILAALMAMSGSLWAGDLCVSHDDIIQFEIDENLGTWFTESMPAGEHRSFSDVMELEEGKLVFENYSTRIVLESSKIKSTIPAALFIEGKFIRSFVFHCETYQLSKTSIWKTSFSNELKQMAMGLEYNESDRMNLARRIHNPRTFEFSKYSRTLSFELADIGDWYVVDLNAKREALIKDFLYKEKGEVLELVKKQKRVQIEGYVFARDWYWGSGYIGIVLKKKNDLMILPIPFEGQVSFGEEQLDSVY